MNDPNRQSDYNQYYDDFPFKSYDEIQEARRRAGSRRRGCLGAFLVVTVLLLVTIVFTWLSGGVLARRFLQSSMDKHGPREETESVGTQTEEPDGPSDIRLEQPESGGAPLIMTYDVSGVVEGAQGSVVGIVTESYSSFSSGSTGTGIIMSEDGYIITNNHVIDGGDNITVVLPDSTNYPAYRIGVDAQTDLAVLKIEPNGVKLQAATFGDSESLRAGEPAIVIGNPGGLDLQGTVTAGIISATDRQIQVDSNVMHLIQTDASINPGNSGGPLLNKYGQVVGVTSNKISASGFEGLGFAIPMHTVKPIVEQLIEHGFVSGRPIVGVRVRTVSQMAAAFYNLPRGLLIDAVASDSAAAQAGLLEGDILTHFCGQPVRSIADATAIRNKHQAGETVTLSYYRSGTVHDIEFALNEQQGGGTAWDF